MSCRLVFAGVAVVSTYDMDPSVFSRLVLAVFGSPSFSSTLFLSSSVATICVHAIFEVADDVGESRDLDDCRGVGLCLICHLGELLLHG